MHKDAARRRFDVVMAWSVDRLGRSLQDLCGFLSELHSLGIDLFLHQQGIDTTTPAGKAMFQMMGVFAEFERSMIVERVRAGVARAKASGTKSGKAFGRPRVPAETEQRIREALVAYQQFGASRDAGRRGGRPYKHSARADRQGGDASSLASERNGRMGPQARRDRLVPRGIVGDLDGAATRRLRRYGMKRKAGERPVKSMSVAF
jgi:hypothetical protein